MTQLPEVEVIKRELEKELVGKKIKDVWLSPAELVKRHGTIKDFSASLVDNKIVSVDRKGMCLLFELDNDTTLVAIPGSRARMTKETAKEARGDATRMVLQWTTGGSVHYHDLEADGELFVVDTDKVDELDDLAKLGMDPLAEPIPWPVFSSALTDRKDLLKAVMVDDSFVVGLGNIYSDEILFEAGLAPARNSATLSSQEVRRLHRAILEVIYEAIKQGGTDKAPSETDKGFLPYDEVGHLKIYAREGQADARSRAIIEYGKIKKGLYAYHSPRTQT
ncbi:Formamidopyrimidine-DNA glycosylase [Euzebya pacifica]|uniref:Formamidopyrimidine-DNA glycosylase n=1 Tax=Euzebya pacifica TaxID=1608957 RepID=A0A346Y0X9_9ACTN|nr:DNA-formamidopyrimidine glycosylase family protein [Euzebya pacifica]AXV08126.1 Formamidopyrimidine-DNA glycosylase [Euzebya pacifica]